VPEVGPVWTARAAPEISSTVVTRSPVVSSYRQRMHRRLVPYRVSSSLAPFCPGFKVLSVRMKVARLQVRAR
jgi:hypothetical protein